MTPTTPQSAQTVACDPYAWMDMLIWLREFRRASPERAEEIVRIGPCLYWDGENEAPRRGRP